ncbi:MAG: lipid-A-disaccharide synthase [Pirellulales bacterium]|nr:lipid-A-disaccharide synthase [Pirellulales bacterium]
MKIFFSVGEPSGDLHGANLIRELQRLRPDIRCAGYGGPRMAEAGCELHFELTKLAVMWFARVLWNLLTFFQLCRRADRYFQTERPDAVVLIDYPGFNWWIARRAKRHGIPVYYFSPPQIWAWASWRIAKMRKYVDHVLSGLPFEAAWLAEQGVRATFVGHPYFDEVRRQKLEHDFIDQLHLQGQWVTLLPGSRSQEVELNLPIMLRAAALIRARVPRVNFAIAAFTARHAQLARRLLADVPLDVAVYVGKTPELIAVADCCLATSGSVSLELLHHKKPTVIVYMISRLAMWVQQWFVRVRYITLINLLLAKEIFLGQKEYSGTWGQQAGRGGRDKPPEKALFPEYLTWQDKSPQIAAHLIRWLLVEEYHDGVAAELGKLKAKIAHGGASRNAAQIIMAEVIDRAAQPLAPHYQPQRETAEMTQTTETAQGKAA